jgi:hypothetical protein
MNRRRNATRPGAETATSCPPMSIEMGSPQSLRPTATASQSTAKPSVGRASTSIEQLTRSARLRGRSLRARGIMNSAPVAPGDLPLDKYRVERTSKRQPRPSSPHADAHVGGVGEPSICSERFRGSVFQRRGEIHAQRLLPLRRCRLGPGRPRAASRARRCSEHKTRRPRREAVADLVRGAVSTCRSLRSLGSRRYRSRRRPCTRLHRHRSRRSQSLRCRWTRRNRRHRQAPGRAR